MTEEEGGLRLMNGVNALRAETDSQQAERRIVVVKHNASMAKDQ